MNNQISFNSLQIKDLELLKKWFNEAHVKEFWHESDDIVALKNKFIDEHPKHGVKSFIIYYNDEPIGYVQSYEAEKAGQGWWADAEPGTFGIDLFIGDNKMIGKGIGTRIVKEFITKISREFDVKKIIIDPSPENAKMIHICEKIGFINKGLINTPGGESVLMELTIP